VLSSDGNSVAGSTGRNTIVRVRTALSLAGAAIAVAVLAGCSMSSSGSSGSASPSSSASGSSSSSADLSTASSTLGQIVVDGKGMTVYVYDKDTKGATSSACTGACATNWPAVTTTSATPKVDGVSGTVGTIPAAGGAKQITLNGWPLYTYAGDSAAGQVTGQGLQGVWWVVSPSGDKNTGATSSGKTSSY
jgi:predicted lipoprotein with Yx(FWY)xxD motif